MTQFHDKLGKHVTAELLDTGVSDAEVVQAHETVLRLLLEQRLIKPGTTATVNV